MSSLRGERKSIDTFIDESGYTWVRLMRTWKPGPVPKSIVEGVKRKYLIHMAATNIVWKSAHYAGVTVTTINSWKRRGIISDAELETAYEMYQERVSRAI